MTQEHVTRCWLCGTVNPCATAVTDEPMKNEPPVENGNYSFCWNCGAWGIFDDTRPDGMREPTRRELADIKRNPAARIISRGWRMARAPRQ
jgi:hypothetical protein